MIKGCQKQIIVMQTQESELFESAYFILRRGGVPRTRCDMLAEANRIIGEGAQQRPRKRFGRRFFFFSGLLCGAVLFALVMLLLRLFAT